MDHNTYFNKIAHKHYEKQKAILNCINISGRYPYY